MKPFISEIPGLESVTIEDQFAPFVNPFDKSEGAYVRSSCWPVDGKISENGSVDTEEVVVSVTYPFRRFF